MSLVCFSVARSLTDSLTTERCKYKVCVLKVSTRLEFFSTGGSLVDSSARQRCFRKNTREKRMRTSNILKQKNQMKSEIKVRCTKTACMNDEDDEQIQHFLQLDLKRKPTRRAKNGSSLQQNKVPYVTLNLDCFSPILLVLAWLYTLPPQQPRVFARLARWCIKRSTGILIIVQTPLLYNNSVCN